MYWNFIRGCIHFLRCRWVEINGPALDLATWSGGRNPGTQQLGVWLYPRTFYPIYNHTNSNVLNNHINQSFSINEL